MRWAGLFTKLDVEVNRAGYFGRTFSVAKRGAKSVLPVLDSVYLSSLGNPPPHAAGDDYVYRVEGGSFR